MDMSCRFVTILTQNDGEQFKNHKCFTDCLEDPLPAVSGGTRTWDNMYGYNNLVTYTCNGGMARSYAHCNGEVWAYSDTDTNCYDGVPSPPPCKIKVFHASGTISSTDPQYQGCRVIISIPNSIITVVTTKFMV